MSAPGIVAGRLGAEDYAHNFDDAVPPLDRQAALIEANRCYFCHDAPCMEACPTGIDIPGFIRKIATENLEGSALRILEENIFGGSCARVCPTEILCERACVRNAEEGKPIAIGRLQRHATDHGLKPGAHPFPRQAPSGKRVAVVGGGPAGLACAHRLATLGHEATVYDARPRLGGLNEYGVAEYKVPHDYAQREVEFVLGVGGIEVKTGQALGRDLFLADLRRQFDAVFLGMGLAGVKALECEGEDLAGVANAVDFIARLRQAEDFASLPVGRQVVVIGGGNTAIDVAVQSRRLGAEQVTLVYRRGPGDMSATDHEQEFAQVNGVRIVHWARPVRIEGSGGLAQAVVFERTTLDESGKLIGLNDTFAVEADMIFKAIGQVFIPEPLNGRGGEGLALENGRIRTDDRGRTSLPGVWAGGDCASVGQDLTVAAVQAGKLAAIDIDRSLRS